jgi:hypothetical protein
LPDYLPLTAVHPDAFDPGTAQTPGSLRLAAIDHDHGITTGLWGGTFLVKAGARTGIHHHGKQETVVYVLEGESLVRWGEHGETEALVRAGDQPLPGASLPLDRSPQHAGSDRREPTRQLLGMIVCTRVRATQSGYRT